ncbi:MmcQ/YjbR family DNA-binding protein [bacterium]|nr:MmcQ/YjbR family DNA-binding protein [bacterium]
MTVTEIQNFCEKLEDSHEVIQWGNDLVFKVGKKMYAVLNFTDPLQVTVKATLDEQSELVTNYKEISVASYVGRFGWVTVSLTEGFDKDFFFSLLKKSYDYVAKKK